MRSRKRFAALLLAAALCISALAGCTKADAGLSLSVCVGPAPESLDPIYAQDVTGQTVLVHLYENLMRVVSDTNGGSTVVNGMAKSVEQEKNHDGTVTYTFRLRSAKWSDGKAVRAADFVYAWQRLADPASGSPNASLLSIVQGYEEARAQKDMSLLQVSAKNDSTLVVTLSGSYDWFLTEVCTAPATMPLRQDVIQQLKTQNTGSWWSEPTALVTNGPYLASGESAEDQLTLSVNDRYYNTNTQNPQTLIFHYADTAETADALYNAKTVDIVWPLTENRLAELAADPDWTPTPQLEVYTIAYNTNSDQLADPLIRQALALSIDRGALVEQAGVTALAAEGLVPSGVPENEDGDFRATGGALLEDDPESYEERCAQAVELLNEAGYDRGSELGTLEYLYLDEGTNGAVAEALCQQWQAALGVRVTPQSVATEQELWTALRAGSYTLAGVELSATVNDAESFLMDWTSDSSNNVVGYANSAYDTLMAIIANASDGSARMGCLHDAEALLLADYVLSPLYTDGTAWDIRDTLTGVCRDARGWFNFAGVMTRTT
jgi:oligopeptide transport system substrate-binding protein